MTNTNVEKLQILQDELITDKELEKMKEIIWLVERLYDREKKYDEVLPAINDLPKYTVNDKENIALLYRESIYKLALYANFINRFELFQNPVVYNIVNEELSKEIEQFPVYNSDIPAGLKEAITNARCNASRKGYVDYSLMLYLFAYKYGKEFPDLTEELNTAIGRRDKKIEEAEKHKKSIKKLGAKAALWLMISVSVYVAPFFLIRKLSNRWSTKKEYAPEMIVDDNEPKRREYYNMPFSGSFPEDYKEQKLQYITEFGKTTNNKVVIKVYDYTGINVSKENLDNMDLDINKLVYCNVEDTEFQNNNYSKYLGEYTGEAHRNITTLENHLYVTRDESSYWISMVFLSVIVYGILIGIECSLPSDGIYLLLGKVHDLLGRRRITIRNKERAEKAIEEIKGEIDNLVEDVFISYKSKNLDTYKEKYGDSEEEFEKVLRRK